MELKPSIGRIVVALVNPAENNGADVCPAIITRVWSDSMVNIKTINDDHNHTQWKTSVTLFATEQEARDHGQHACYWPARV